MPRTAHNINARTTAALKTALDAWFTANSTLTIRHFQLVGADMESLTNTEMAVSIMAETGGAQMGAPMVATFFQAGTPTALQALIDAQIALSPNIWYQGPFLINLSKRRRTYDWIGLLLSCTDAVNAATNWTPS